jgi:hypothetical protein
MSVTKSLKNTIKSPDGNSLALFVDDVDGVIKIKDINGNVQNLSDYITSSSGGNLKVANDISTTLQAVSDNKNNFSALRIASNQVANYGKGGIGTNTAFGASALTNNTTGYENTAIGNLALNSNTTGYDNVGIGYRSGFSINTGFKNVAIGSFANETATNATGVTAIGYQALQNNVYSNNTAIGTYASRLNTTGTYNISVGGSSAENNTTGSYNTAIGAASLFANSIGENNVAIGTYSLQNNTSNNNVGIGFSAGNTIVAGQSNVLIGSNAQVNTSSHSSVIGIGQDVVAHDASIVIGRGASSTGANQFVVGSAAYNAGTIRVESLTSDRSWSVIINGIPYKVLLKS